MNKKSSIRIFSKKLFLGIHLIISVVLLYPIIFTPLSFIWINGFFGLAVPYLIIAQLLFLFFWLVAKPIISLISFVTLAVSWKTLIALVAWHPGTNLSLNKRDNNIRIISWNVKGFNGNQASSPLKLRTQDIAYSIQKWNPDIICLQEYNTNEKPKDIGNHSSYFSKQYPYSFFSKDYQINAKDYFAGCIIFSKYKIIRSARLPYANQEALIYVDLQKGDDTIRVYTTHLASFNFKENDYRAIDEVAQSSDEALLAKKGVMRKMKKAFIERSIQANFVKKELNKTPYPSIFTGDFNDVPSSYTYKIIANDWQDAFLQKGFGIGVTYNGISPTLRIDYILANSSWKIKGWESVDENLSDHHMIIADLLLQKN